ncbi:MAG TPA: bifunctional histidinol-phosphatase/imidazoleglycerol-phosphate dehydratase HisB [Chitinophagales bacterium]|nr:bifunctional histidinol-phosphatase/imidazoleglycerol-phosphate dehydratase HisB [Chitinophagales bacterium]
MKKILFIDQDGTIVIEPEDEKLDSFEKLRFLPGAISCLSRIARELNFEFVMVTNQDGLGTAHFPEDEFFPFHGKMLEILKGEGVEFREVCIDRTFPDDKADTRKPGIGMLKHYLNDDYDIANSFVIGDRYTDALLAKNLGCKAIHLQSPLSKNHLGTWKKDEVVALYTSDWNEVYQFLKRQSGKTVVQRKTSETDIYVELNPDGSGTASIDTGLGFFNHMLEQLAKHAGLDLTVKAKGDLHIDEHHTIEDTALALGEAFHKSLGTKKEICRYGFVLPMDDSLAQAAIDFGGRPWLEWKAEFRREKVGDMPTEMFRHFFKSFCDTAKCNLHIKAEGENEHHKIEAIFKAVARAIRMAVRREEGFGIPSTKGVL